MTNLLPCPFCGHETPGIERPGTSRQSCIVACGHCGTRHESSDEGSDSGASWNTRACVEHALAGRGGGLEPLRKLLQEHLDALTAAQPAEKLSPDNLFKGSDGEWMHEVGGVLVRDRYRAGALIERRPMADLCQSQPAGVSEVEVEAFCEDYFDAWGRPPEPELQGELRAAVRRGFLAARAAVKP